jgi:hypothetical protein
MVRGSGVMRRLDGGRMIPVPTATAAGRSGAVWTGEWVDRRGSMTRIGHWLDGRLPRTVEAMQSITSPRPRRRPGSLLVGCVVGMSLVAAGLGIAYVAIETPLVSTLVPASRSGSSRMMIALMVWTLGLVAGAALFVAGTNRLAVMVADVRSRSRSRRGSPVLRALAALPADVVVATGVVPNDGRPIPELVIGPFGVAVVHEMGKGDRIRRVGRSWEARTAQGWVPTEHPLDRAARDAERVRHWLTHGDLDFVVRIHAALVTPDASMPRSPLCAVITVDQIPAWVAALPRQRSLNAGRRQRLVARVREAVAAEPGNGW